MAKLLQRESKVFWVSVNIDDRKGAGNDLAARDFTSVLVCNRVNELRQGKMMDGCPASFVGANHNSVQDRDSQQESDETGSKAGHYDKLIPYSSRKIDPENNADQDERANSLSNILVSPSIHKQLFLKTRA